MPTSYCKKLAVLAEGEFNKLHGFHETTPEMAARIKRYWADIGLQFPGVNVAWSAVFVSYFIKQAGATAQEFRFSARHSEFVHSAIANQQAGVGLFRGRRLGEYAPKIGDIVQNNRGGNSFDFDFAARNSQYESHSAIIVEEGVDGSGRYVRTIGGNESDTVGDHVIRLGTQGKIKQPASDPSRFICIVENLK